jgi:hypothetical protein
MINMMINNYVYGKLNQIKKVEERTELYIYIYCG